MDLPHLLLDRAFEQIVVAKDAEAGCLAFVVVHSTALGPAFGGIRRWPYRDPVEALTDAMNLAEAMTLKCAVAGIPGGGAKAVLLQTPDLQREAAYRVVGRCVEQLGGRFYTGPDVGTYPQDLEAVARETRFVARPGPDGPGDLAGPTAQGVHAAIRTIARRLGHGRDNVSGAAVAGASAGAGRRLEGLRVLVQGLGEVGYRLASLLALDGARLLVSDVRPANVEAAVTTLGATAVDPADVLATEADVLAPCALGGVITEKNVPGLRVRAIAGSANNVLATPEAGAALFARGILYAPDFVISAGALLHGALFHLEGKVPSPERIAHIGEQLEQILERAEREGQSPEQLALTMARERLAQARAARAGGRV